MTERKHATRVRTTLRGEQVEFTNARDENGILVDATIEDVERMGREAFLEYQARRNQEIADRQAAAQEADDERRFEEAFLAEGGNKSDAAAAYKAHKNQRAAEAASRAEREALHHARRLISGKV